MSKFISQRCWITNRLINTGQISRNECLQKHITRLGAHIHAIKALNPTWKIEAKYINKSSNSEDYIYKLTNRDEILENIDKKLQKIGA